MMNGHVDPPSVSSPEPQVILYFYCLNSLEILDYLNHNF